MISTEKEISDLVNALPQNFQFYHLGEVQLKPIDFDLQDETIAIAYQIYGDIKALLIVLFAQDLDTSTYCELGNVLASKIANQLNSENNLDVLISPPQTLSKAQLAQITQSALTIVRRTY